MNEIFRFADRDVRHSYVLAADRALLALAASNHSLVLRRDVTRAGLSKNQWERRLASGEWIPVSVDVWRHALVPDSWWLRARAGLMYLGADAALYGLTSAAWSRLDVPDPTEVEFVVPRGRRRLNNDLAIHTTQNWHPGDLVRVDGVQVTSAARTIIDMAASGRRAAVIESAIDSAVRQRKTSVPTLTRRMDELAGSGRDGIRLLRALLLDSGGESYLERRFLRLLARQALPRPQLQVVHRDDSSARVMRVDFEYPDLGIVVEVSGRLGHTSDRDRQKDARRRNALQREGKLVLEFTTADVLDDAAYVVRTLRNSFMSPLGHGFRAVRAT